MGGREMAGDMDGEKVRGCAEGAIIQEIYQDIDLLYIDISA